MAVITAEEISQLAKQLFRSKGIRLPTNFSGLPPQAPFGPKDQVAPDPTALFVAPSTLSYHVNTAKTIGKDIEDLIDACARAIARAFSQWQSSAKFAGIIINGPTGNGLPGCLVGPPVMTGSSIFSMVNTAGRQAMFVKYCRSITMAVGTAFETWRLGYMVTLVFPGGAVCSATMPPSPNIPVPVASGSSTGDAMTNASALKGLMLAQHGTVGNHTLDIFDAFAQAFSMVFVKWKASTMITNVIGAGGVAPVPPAPPGPVAAAIGSGGALV